MKLWRYGRAIERLGQRYRLDGMLGSGGMADVCLGWDEQNQQEVAIKLLKAEGINHKTLNRFVAEAGTIVHWRHPHILQVYSEIQLELLDKASGSIVPYIVMEYASGGDLQKRLAPDRPLPLTRVLHLFAQMASAVQYAHEQGVIHRDLKPLNLLFRVLPGGQEELVLSDFGLAVDVEASHHTFAHGGTLVYMAPEQILDRAVAASDIFALGVILYQLCTGHMPFRRSLSELNEADFRKPPALPHSLNPRLPPALDGVILKALAYEPEQRYATAMQLWDAVDMALGRPAVMENLASPLSSGSTTRVLRPLAPAVSSPLAGPNSTLSDEPDPALPASSPSQSIIRSSGRSQPAFSQRPTTNISEMSSDPLAGPEALSLRSQRSYATAPRVVSRSSASAQSPPTPVARPAASAPPASRPQTSSGTRRRPSLFWLVALALAILVVGTVVLYAARLLAPATALVISPASKHLLETYTVTALSNPDPNQRQVSTRELTFTTPTQTKTVNATGHTTQPGKAATGTVTFFNGSFTNSATLVAGTDIPVGQIHIITDATAVIPAAIVGVSGQGQATVPAHASAIGAAGNIPASAINGICCGSTALAARNAAFTGGQDPQNFTSVAQGDIDGATRSLTASLVVAGQQGIQTQLRGNERMARPVLCNPVVNADHQVGEKANQVTVTASADCNDIAYDYDAARALSMELLKQQATTSLGAAYALVGSIRTNIQASGQQTGNVTLQIQTEGIWVYRFDAAQQQALRRLVAGKSQAVARALLQRQVGVERVVSMPGSDPLPSDPTQISLTIRAISGLSQT